MKSFFIFFIALILLSCKEEKKSRLYIPKVNNTNESIKIPKINLTSIIERKLRSNSDDLSYWDKYNLNQLNSNTVEDEIILSLTNNNFEFSYEFDSCFYFDGTFAPKKLLINGIINNKTKYDLFFIATSCNGLDYNLFFNGNAHASPFFYCNISVPIVNVLKADSSYHFQTIISIKENNKSIKAGLLLELISNNVNVKNIKPISKIRLFTLSKNIDKKFHYILTNQ